LGIEVDFLGDDARLVLAGRGVLQADVAVGGSLGLAAAQNDCLIGVVRGDFHVAVRRLVERHNADAAVWCGHLAGALLARRLGSGGGLGAATFRLAREFDLAGIRDEANVAITAGLGRRALGWGTLGCGTLGSRALGCRSGPGALAGAALAAGRP